MTKMGKVPGQQNKNKKLIGEGLKLWLRLPRKRISKKEWEAAKWRWEFMRLNEYYQKEYRDREKREAPKVLPQRNRWVLGEWLDPDLSFKELYEQCYQQVLELDKEDIEPKEAAEFLLFNILGGPYYYNDAPAVTPQLSIQGPEGKETEIVGLHINTSAPDKQIIEEVMEYVIKDRASKNITQKIKREKPQWMKYKRYLEVLELKRQGYTHEEISDKLFPDLDLDSARTKVSRNLESARLLINGGYKKIK